MSSRESILKALEKETLKPETHPEITLDAIQYENPIEVFKENCELAGAQVFIPSDPHCPKAIVHELFPDCSSILSYAEGIESNVNLSEVKSGHDLNSLELTVIKGELGVCENGAIWVDIKDLRFRSSLFICQHLVILLKAGSIVHNLHEAYEKVDFKGSNYGLFISGPSKTADIEQALVIGAHGPRSCSVIIEP